MSNYDCQYFNYSDGEEDILDSVSYSSKNEPTSEQNKKFKAVSPKKVLKLHHSKLTKFEKTEILNYEKVYFIGNLIKTLHKTIYNNGFDDSDGIYIFESHDHIAYRYEILKRLGKGAFGQVFSVYDHKRQTKLALKIIKNKPAFHRQAKVEVEILKILKLADKEGKFNFVSMKSYFIFRNHVCITFELLTINLYHFLKENNFIGFSQTFVRRFAYSIVKSLNALSELKIIHCDLKPENIVLRQNSRSGIKLIDFGSSYLIGSSNTKFNYLQSRFYRAPEVILQADYSLPIDIWSLGCIISELTSGRVLFKGSNYLDQLASILSLGKVLGNLPERFCKGEVWYKFIKSEYYEQADKKHEDQLYNHPAMKPKLRYLAERKNSNLLLSESKNSSEIKDFILKCLNLDPEKRMKPKQALEHSFLNLKQKKLKDVLNQVKLLPKSYYLNKKNSETSQLLKIKDLVLVN